MARAARVPGSGPGRANVRSPRPRAVGAPASTPGADRYASGGGRPGAPPPSGASDCRSGASRAAVGAGWMREGAPRGGRPAPTPYSMPLFSSVSPSFHYLSVSVSPYPSRGGTGQPPPAGGRRQRQCFPLLSFSSSLWEPGSPRWLLWGQGLGQWDQRTKKRSVQNLRSTRKKLPEIKINNTLIFLKCKLNAKNSVVNKISTI